MNSQSPIPKQFWDMIPPAAQAALQGAFEQLSGRIAQLERENAELKARLNQNSTNSSKPPSSDPPSVKRAPPKRPTGKKRGGQHGHEAHHRALVPPEKVSEWFDIDRKKIPCWLRARVGQGLQCDVAAGHDLPDDIDRYESALTTATATTRIEGVRDR